MKHATPAEGFAHHAAMRVASEDGDAKWAAATFVGFQLVDANFRLELRNCACGSTVARAVPWVGERRYPTRNSAN